MTHNHQLQPPKSPSAVTTTTCAICNSDDHWILHNHVEFRTTSPRKLCTSCFLKLYPASFCPTCFNLHDPNSITPPPLMTSSSSSSSSSNRYLTCLKCNSISHVTCVPVNTPKSPYLCPPCSNPSFKFFDLRNSRKFADKTPLTGVSGGSDSCGLNLKNVVVEQQQQQVIDDRAARVLLLAAKMSAISMNRAAGAARSEAERKVKDAALARKRAKEAIDHVMMLSSKLVTVKQQRRDVHPVVLNSSPGSNFVPVKLEKNGGVHNGNVVVPGVDNGNGNGTVAAPINGGNVESNKNHVGTETAAG